MFWRCMVRNCPARLHTDINQQNPMTRGRGHNHLARPEKIVVRQRIQTMRHRATTEQLLSMPQVYREETRNLTELQQTVMPTFTNIYATLYRARRENVPALPAQRIDVVIQPPYSFTDDGQLFFQVSRQIKW